MIIRNTSPKDNVDIDSSHKAAHATGVVTRIKPGRFTLTRQNRRELTEQRGLSPETIESAMLGSLRTQEDLDSLRLDWHVDRIESLIVIPYLNTADAKGDCLYRPHKRSLPDATYPPYEAPVLNADGPVVICESEFKALAAAQLGYRAIGLQGIDAFVNRQQELIRVVKSYGIDSVFVCLDLEREIVDDPE